MCITYIFFVKAIGVVTLKKKLDFYIYQYKTQSITYRFVKKARAVEKPEILQFRLKTSNLRNFEKKNFEKLYLKNLEQLAIFFWQPRIYRNKNI